MRTANRQSFSSLQSNDMSPFKVTASSGTRTAGGSCAVFHKREALSQPIDLPAPVCVSCWLVGSPVGFFFAACLRRVEAWPRDGGVLFGKNAQQVQASSFG